jgi:hypothetical protein
MSTAPQTPNLRDDLAVRTYVVICLFSLLVTLLAVVTGEQQAGLGPLGTILALVPILVGAVGLGLRSGLAPVLFLTTLSGFLFLRHQHPTPAPFGWRWGPPRGTLFHASDVLLAMAVLAFVMAHSRLMGLVGNLFPRDPRRKEERRRPSWFGGRFREVKQRRSTRLVRPVEWAFLLLSLPVWAGAAELLWLITMGLTRPRRSSGVGMEPWLWRLIVVAWVLGALLVLAAGFFSYWGRRDMTPEEGQMLLQDTLWNETRREQRWLTRWLAWDRLRRPKEEKPS